MTIHEKRIFKCDRCESVYEWTISEGAYCSLPPFWSTHDGKHFCQNHRISVTVFDLVGEKGEWQQGK